MAALFQKAGFVDHQHGLWVLQMLHHITVQFLADGLWVPQGPAQQVLNGIRRGVAAHFGQLPAIFALSRAEQAAQIRHRPLPGLGALEIGARRRSISLM